MQSNPGDMHVAYEHEVEQDGGYMFDKVGAQQAHSRTHGYYIRQRDIFAQDFDERKLQGGKYNAARQVRMYIYARKDSQVNYHRGAYADTSPKLNIRRMWGGGRGARVALIHRSHTACYLHWRGGTGSLDPK